MPDLASLLRLAPPPVRPIGAGNEWGTAEDALGTALPSDFKTLVDTYGEGQFQDFLTLLVPAPSSGAPGLAAFLADERGYRQELDDNEAAWVRGRGETAQAGEPWPPMFPEPDGLLPWAMTSNGDRVCWRTGGEAESWSCAVWNPRGHYPGEGGAFEEHAYGCVELLARWLDGTGGSPALGGGVGPGVHGTWFEPYRHLHVAEVVQAASPFTPGERLGRLHARLGHVVERTAYEGEDGAQWQFLGGPGRWVVTYGWYRYVQDGTVGVGHRLAIRFPPHEDDAVRRFLLDISTEVNCDIRYVWHQNTDGTEWLLSGE